MERYAKGDFQISDVDFTCLRRAVNFIVDRRRKVAEFEADKTHLTEVKEKVKDET